jgi:predicted RNA-binding protein with PUA-like domain
MARGSWLFKSDPDTFGWQDLIDSPDATTCWDGVRNYQARNFLRDDAREGDRVLFYHSQTAKAVVGIAEIVRAGYPDPTQFDRRQKGYDPKSTKDDPRWYAVDIRVVDALDRPVDLDTMRRHEQLADMLLLKRGNRLSVFPVTAKEFRIVERLGRL